MITPNIDNQVCFIASCSGREQSLRWLYGSRSDGTVKLTGRLPSADVNYSGALWKFQAVGGDNTFNIRCLADPENSQHVYLEASGNDGVSLDDADSNNNSNAKWIIEQASDAATPYYPQYPWDGQGKLFTFFIRNFNSALDDNLLYGNPESGLVKLTEKDNTDWTGVHWMVLVPIMLSD